MSGLQRAATFDVEERQGAAHLQAKAAARRLFYAQVVAALFEPPYADGLSDAAIDAVLGAMASATSPMSMVQFRGLGGAVARVGHDDTAFAHRDKRYLAAVLGLWPDAAEDPAPHRAWVESLWRQLRPESRGAYVNFLADEGEERIREAYPGSTFARLAEIKKKYDPTNLLRFNQNIRQQA